MIQINSKMIMAAWHDIPIVSRNSSDLQSTTRFSLAMAGGRTNEFKFSYYSDAMFSFSGSI